MSKPTRAFATIDRGTATTAVALIGWAGGRHRLLGATAGPAGVRESVLLERVRRRAMAADPSLVEAIGLELEGSAADLPRLECSTPVPRELAVVAATERVLKPLAAVGERSGWRVRRVVIDGADILKVATSLADRHVDAILAGASEPPGADERSLIAELGTLVAATTERRPDLVTVLAGGLAAPGGRTEQLFRPDRPGPTVLAPSPADDGGEPLRALLDSLRGGHDDARRALAVATGSLARVLRRRVEVLEIGQSGGSRTLAAWQPGGESWVQTASVTRAALLPKPFADADLDAVIGWLPVAVDRLRLRDRLREMATAPWADAAGDGAIVRLASVRAATVRLLEATPAFDALPAPDLVLVTGGAWLAGPATAAVLAVADVARRPGARAVGMDHARILAPIGTIEDDGERARLIADLRDDMLVPLGTIVLAAGLRSSRAAGQLTVHGADGPLDVELPLGGVELVDVPPGEHANVELQFREVVDIGVRARHMALVVTGGLGGLVVDLRDVPLRLPDRLEPRRELLASWQGVVWPGIDQ
ncbi:MAG TPA: hypothetical protein VIR16_04715 [Candidatus Limnocylindrales bacterium]